MPESCFKKVECMVKTANKIFKSIQWVGKSKKTNSRISKEVTPVIQPVHWIQFYSTDRAS